MPVRYLFAAAASAVVTFGLLYAMQALVRGGDIELREDKTRYELGFVRVKRDTQLQRKKRTKPTRIEKPEAPEPSAPPMDNLAADLSVDIPLMDAAELIADGPGMGMGADSEPVPMVRVNPQYPARAASRGIEGWVHLRFTVTAQGATTDVKVVEAQPRGYFENASIAAVKRYKYKPKMQGGTAVAHQGVEVVLTFELEK